mgnify:CR=1 FL=1
MNSELFSWGTRVPVSTALRGKSDLELSKEIQDSLSEVKWKMFGLEFFLVLEALLFLFTCYQVVKAGRILDEIQGNLSEVKRGERVGAKRKYGTQNKYTGLSKGLEPEEKFRSGKNTWGEIRRKEKKKEKKKDQLAEVSRRRSLYSSLDELKEPVLSSSESDEKAIRAWKALSRAGEATGQLTKIVQGPQESFSDFVARETEAGSCSLQGLIVHPGVVDQDCKGELQVLCSCPQVVFSISQGDRIAQLIILPSLHGCFPSSGIPRAARGIGSTGNDSDYLIMPLDCCQILSTHVGVNPRGVRPLQVWQMDVTHISSFGRNQYLHVC